MEFWDIYDENKQRTGKTMRRNDWTMADDEYHLTVIGVVKRGDGKFLITQRAMDKAWAPGAWEISGGGVQAGEESEDAIRREILEETGLDVTGAEGGYQFSYIRKSPGDNYHMDVYRFEMDFKEEDIIPELRETIGYRIATREEIHALGAEGNFLHYDSIRKLFV